jgi:hypothetical protein
MGIIADLNKSVVSVCRFPTSSYSLDARPCLCYSNMTVDAVLSCTYGHCTGVFDRGKRFEAGPAYGFHDSSVYAA